MGELEQLLFSWISFQMSLLDCLHIGPAQSVAVVSTFSSAVQTFACI